VAALGYSGTAGDGFSGINNYNMFSTTDVDRDGYVFLVILWYLLACILLINLFTPISST